MKFFKKRDPEVNKRQYLKNKIKSDIKNHLDLHLAPVEKYVQIVTVPNIYGFEFLKQITQDNILDFDNLIYSENGGYIFDKKTF